MITRRDPTILLLILIFPDSMSLLASLLYRRPYRFEKDWRWSHSRARLRHSRKVGGDHVVTQSIALASVVSQ